MCFNDPGIVLKKEGYVRQEGTPQPRGEVVWGLVRKRERLVLAIQEAVRKVFSHAAVPVTWTLAGFNFFPGQPFVYLSNAWSKCFLT